MTTYSTTAARCKKRRDALTAAGLCHRCKKRTSGKTQCDACLEAFYTQRKARRKCVEEALWALVFWPVLPCSKCGGSGHAPMPKA